MGELTVLNSNQMTAETDPMGNSRFHKILVQSNELQKIPYPLIFLILLALVGLVWLIWQNLFPVMFFAIFAVFNWALLWMLPRSKRSYGPEKPSALALWGVLAFIMLVTGILGMSEIVAYLLMGAVSWIAYYSTWIEPFSLGVSNEKLQSAKWNAAAAPLRVLHIGDLHMEYMTPREQQLNQLVKQLEPDMIVFSGDFVNLSYTNDERVKDLIRGVISQWKAPLGVFCVPGTYTVEPVERVIQFTAGLDNVRLLLNEWVSVDTPAGKFNILGLRTTHVLQTDREALHRMMASAPPEGFNLLLTHSPDLALDADASGIDLYLCGHTHGGQIRFPLIGPLFSGSALGMRYVMGRYLLTRSTLYTTRGVGLEGLGAPRARFMCPPEVVLWDIRGKAAV